MIIKKQAAQPASASLNSSWLTANRTVLKGITQVMGTSAYTAREGVNTGGLSGCYWVRILSERDKSSVLVENLYDEGKKKLDRTQMSVESDLIYPLLRGRNVQRWYAKPMGFIIAPQDTEKHREGIPEQRLRREFPKTYAYLKHFEKALADRADRKYYPDKSPFYTMRNVADYTRNNWKVVFKDLSEVLQCAVVGLASVAGNLKPVFPDLTLRLIPVETEAEAHYLAALLNSSPCVVMLHASSVGVQTQRYHPGDIAKVGLPCFDPRNKIHITLSELSYKCHSAMSGNFPEKITPLQLKIDKAAADLWGIAQGELKAIQDAVDEVQGGSSVEETACGEE